MRFLHEAAWCRDADRTAIEQYGLPSVCLMEEACVNIAREISRRFDAGSRIIVVAGNGNNGADGLAAARILYAHGYKNVSIYICDGGKRSEENSVHLEVAKRYGIRITDTLEECDCIIDALCGAGLRGPLRQKEASIVNEINSSGACVISLDVPSGLGDSSDGTVAVNADTVLSLGFDKTCLYTPEGRKHFRNIVFIPLSYPPALDTGSAVTLLESCEYKPLELECADYKVSRGRVAIIAGSREYAGAVRLCARAAFHAASGMVSVFTDESLIGVVSAECGPSVIVQPYESFFKKPESFDAVLAGPGLGRSEKAAMLVGRILELPLKTLILDADAIHLAKERGNASRLVFTPHPGEYRAIAEEEVFKEPSGFFAQLLRVSGKWNAEIIYKAECVYVCDGRSITVVDGANPSVGVAGSGDVLAGLVLSVAAAGKEPLVSAVMLHQLAGRALHEEEGYYSAEDLIIKAGQLR